MVDLSNKIDADLKEDLDVAVAKSDYNQREVISAMISYCLDDEEEPVTVDEEKIQNELEHFGERYSQD